MSVNTAHASNGVLIHNGEYILLHSDNVSMDFSGQDSSIFKGTKQGRIYLTSHRVIFNNRKSGDEMQSFSAPFIAMNDVELEQPVFGANYIKGKVRAQPNGNFVGEVKFKLYFKAGGAIEYGMALLRAAKTAQSNYHQGGRLNDDPPPYTPSGNWHEAPPPAYQPPPGYYGWLPSHEAFSGPAPNTVFISDNPPPYPGIGGPPPAYAPQAPQSHLYPSVPPQQPQPYNQQPQPHPYNPYQQPSYNPGQQPSYNPNQPPSYNSSQTPSNPQQQQTYNQPQQQSNQASSQRDDEQPSWNGFSLPPDDSQQQQRNVTSNNSQRHEEIPSWNGFSLPPAGDEQRRTQQQQQSSAPPGAGAQPNPTAGWGGGYPSHEPAQPYPPYPNFPQQGYPPYPPQQHGGGNIPPYPPQQHGGGNIPPYPPAAGFPMGFTAPYHNSKEAESLASAYNTTENQRQHGPSSSGHLPPAYEELPPSYLEYNKKNK